MARAYCLCIIQVRVFFPSFSVFLPSGLSFAHNELGFFSFSHYFQMYSTSARFGFSIFPRLVLVEALN